MASHDGTVDSGMVLGAPGSGGQTAIGHSGSGSASMRAVSSLTLDEAESIAARRLRELAIRLSDVGSAGGEEPGLTPFDADRHMRRRLARRIASIDSDEFGSDEEVEGSDATELPTRPFAKVGVCPRYVVSEALPMAAFGDGLAALAAGRPALPALPPPAKDELRTSDAAEPEATILDESAQTDASESRADTVVQLEPEVRLIDLINEQRALVDRLGRFDGETGVVFDAMDAGLATAPAEVLRSDAEELFEAGTYAPESVLQAAAEDEDAAPMSAEQLIAALQKAGTEQDAGLGRDVELEPAPASERVLATTLLREFVEREPKAAPLQFLLHRPSLLPGVANGTDLAVRPPSGLGSTDGLSLSDHALEGDASPERPPIIIERARAEMTAMANGTLALAERGPSAAIGFFAGLSISLVCGIALYFAL